MCFTMFIYAGNFFIGGGGAFFFFLHFVFHGVYMYVFARCIFCELEMGEMDMLFVCVCVNWRWERGICFIAKVEVFTTSQFMK